MKKFLSIILAVVMCFSICVPAFAAEVTADTAVTTSAGTQSGFLAAIQKVFDFLKNLFKKDSGDQPAETPVENNGEKSQLDEVIDKIITLLGNGVSYIAVADSIKYYLGQTGVSLGSITKGLIDTGLSVEDVAGIIANLFPENVDKAAVEAYINDLFKNGFDLYEVQAILQQLGQDNVNVAFQWALDKLTSIGQKKDETTGETTGNSFIFWVQDVVNRFFDYVYPLLEKLVGGSSKTD